MQRRGDTLGGGKQGRREDIWRRKEHKEGKQEGSEEELEGKEN